MFVLSDCFLTSFSIKATGLRGESCFNLDSHWTRFCGVSLNTTVLRLTLLTNYLKVLQLKWEHKALSLNVLL